MTATSNTTQVIIMLLLCMVACVIGGYCAIYPNEQVQKWHSGDLSRIPDAKTRFYVFGYRAFGILYVVVSLICTAKTILDYQLVK